MDFHDVDIDSIGVKILLDLNHLKENSPSMVVIGRPNILVGDQSSQ